MVRNVAVTMYLPVVVDVLVSAGRCFLIDALIIDLCLVAAAELVYCIALHLGCWVSVIE